MDEQIVALMMIKADNIILQKKLNKAGKRLTSHYELEELDEKTRAETGSSFGDQHAGEAI